MQELPGAPSPALLLRWATFIVAAATLSFILSYASLDDFAIVMAMGGPAVADLAPELVVALPAALVAVGLMVFHIAALRPRRRRVPIYTQLVFPILVIFLLAAAFIVALHSRMFGLCCLILAAGTMVSAAMLAKVASVSPSKHSSWLRVPFSLCLAVLTVATVAAGSYWLNASGTAPLQISAAPVSLLEGGVLIAAIGVALAYRYHEFVYPLVVTVIAAVAATTAGAYDSSTVMDIVLVGIGMLVISLVAAVASARDPRKSLSAPQRYAREPVRVSVADTQAAAKPPAKPRRHRKAARSSNAPSQRGARQSPGESAEDGPFQGSPTIS